MPDESAQDEVSRIATPGAESMPDVPGQVGELMEDVPSVIQADATAAGTVEFMVRSSRVKDISYFFVVDDQGVLVGVVNLRELILSRPGAPISELMVHEPFAFRHDTPLNQAIHVALERHYPVYPVVDEQQRIIGIVRGWKLFQRATQEAVAQAGAQVGVGREERVSTPVWQAFLQRHPWLQVNLLTAFAAAFVVSQFEDTITRIVALAAFLPVLAGQSGNTGCQALAITLRGLTLGELGHYPVTRLLRKEILLGAINGVLVGVVAAAAMWFYADMTGAENAPALALVILIAMTGACVGSGIFGVLVPLTLKRFGADPATASSIFLTTFTDIIGMGLMLLLATTLVL